MVAVPKEFSDRSICVIGLGYVGLTLAVVMAEVGFDVLGIEVRADIVNDLSRGVSHVKEPGLSERLQRLLARRSISFATRIPDGVPSRVFILTVGTPLDGDGRVRLDMIQRASTEVRDRMHHGDLIILRSTVKLGTTRKLVLPILEASGVSFDLAFCPERTLEGQAMSELRVLPQIVGALTPSAISRTAHLFQFVTPTVIRVHDIETAEIIKLIDNTYRDVSLAYANEVARICDAVGISALEVIQAGKHGYARTNVPLPGPVGGPCLEKDPHILVEGMRELGIEPEIAVAARRINERQPAEIADYLLRLTVALSGFPRSPSIALLGIAFKGRPPTDDLRGTMAKPILHELRMRFPNARFRGFDPMVSMEQIRAFGLQPCATVEEAFAGAHLVIILNNHPTFAALPMETLAATLVQPGLIYDFWNHAIASDLRLPPGTGYVALGSHGRAALPAAIVPEATSIVEHGYARA
ncbi:MAG: nucleotide sugar dehydrogenase [bacterium]|nr:nucleotide sugar dehydrogenase [bacterium]